MGWFDEQIKQRKQNDEAVFQESFFHMADAVLGSRLASALNDSSKQARDAIDEILKYYKIKSTEIPETIVEFEEQLEYLMRPNGIMHRTIHLEKGWYKDSVGPVIAQKKDGSVVALIPSGFSGYRFYDIASAKMVKLDKNNESLFEKEAICFYRPFPLRKMDFKDFFKYMISVLETSDYLFLILASLMVVAVGMLLPQLNNILFSIIVPQKNIQALGAIFAFMISIVVAESLLTALKNLLLARISTKISISVESASMMRMLSLPADFFKDYSSGELAARMQYITAMCDTIIEPVIGGVLTGIFALLYVTEIYLFTPALVWPAFLIVTISFLYSTFCVFCGMNTVKRKLSAETKERGMSYALISGVSKIKLAGAEKRAFARWAKLYSEFAALVPPFLVKMQGAGVLAITSVGMIIFYVIALKNNISVADYYAFYSAYGMISAAFFEVSTIMLLIAQIKPIWKLVEPIMKTEPEVSEGKKVLERIAGGIELSNVSFRYKEDMPNVIDNLSLKIRAGQYVAIVGKTGCGKSTLMRLLLGFEKPQKGAIYYDGKDISKVDLKSLRKKIGVVMQNSSLFMGDIFSNITISAPGLSLQETWEAAELAGIAEDIRQMPMGMFTMVAEGQGGISGGQKQRLMIARAVAPKPKILMFDEATSALDNLTQKKISDALDGLKCTRIVIAHRLSTIKHCDRIIVLDKGKIIEDGTYEELIAQKGFFAELVERQQVNINKK